MFVSIIIPTYNEKQNIEKLIPLLDRYFERDYEIIIVDDSSPDGTADACRGMAKDYPIKVLERPSKMGLASAVVTGFYEAKGDIIGVIDGDMQHPPEFATVLCNSVVNGSDIAIGSRYVKGGHCEDWGLFRKVVSRGAILLAMPLVSVKDPMSGYFFLKRSVVGQINFNPRGFKILLEVLVKGKYSVVDECPYTFELRSVGESKLGKKEYWDYLRLLLHLYLFKIKENLMKPKETYNCGHHIKEVIIDTNKYTLSTYLEWKNSNSGRCLDCWLKNRNTS